jgi:hypothetical protein
MTRRGLLSIDDTIYKSQPLISLQQKPPKIRFHTGLTLLLLMKSLNFKIKNLAKTQGVKSPIKLQ